MGQTVPECPALGRIKVMQTRIGLTAGMLVRQSIVFKLKLSYCDFEKLDNLL